uniref:Uncharacterized protein n=1 Tax=Rhizophora mucronata TaxID=61149 RepID=A0A2P2QR52_RHIMU
MISQNFKLLLCRLAPLRIIYSQFYNIIAF